MTILVHTDLDRWYSTKYRSIRLHSIFFTTPEAFTYNPDFPDPYSDRQDNKQAILLLTVSIRSDENIVPQADLCLW